MFILFIVFIISIPGVWELGDGMRVPVINRRCWRLSTTSQQLLFLPEEPQQQQRVKLHVNENSGRAEQKPLISWICRGLGPRQRTEKNQSRDLYILCSRLSAYSGDLQHHPLILTVCIMIIAVFLCRSLLILEKISDCGVEDEEIAFS